MTTYLTDEEGRELLERLPEPCDAADRPCAWHLLETELRVDGLELELATEAVFHAWARSEFTKAEAMAVLLRFI